MSRRSDRGRSFNRKGQFPSGNGPSLDVRLFETRHYQSRSNLITSGKRGEPDAISVSNPTAAAIRRRVRVPNQMERSRRNPTGMCYIPAKVSPDAIQHRGYPIQLDRTHVLGLDGKVTRGKATRKQRGLKRHRERYV